VWRTFRGTNVECTYWAGCDGLRKSNAVAPLNFVWPSERWWITFTAYAPTHQASCYMEYVCTKWIKVLTEGLAQALAEMWTRTFTIGHWETFIWFAELHHTVSQYWSCIHCQTTTHYKFDHTPCSSYANQSPTSDTKCRRICCQRVIILLSPVSISKRNCS